MGEKGDAGRLLGYSEQPMKNVVTLVGALAACVLLLTACKQEPSVDTTAANETPVVIDTRQADIQFASADPAVKSSFESAVASIKAGNYNEAMGKLGTLASDAKLTKEQQKVIMDLVERVKAKGSSVLNEAGSAASNTVDALGDAASDAAKDVKNAFSK